MEMQGVAKRNSDDVVTQDVFNNVGSSHPSGGGPTEPIKGRVEVESSEQYESAPAYLIYTWPRTCERRIFDSPDDMRQELRKSDGNRLIVLHGLPVRFVEVLRDELGMSASLLEAVAARRIYRPSRSAGNVRTRSFEYPELIKSYSIPPSSPGPYEGRIFAEDMTPIDVMTDSPRYPLDDSGKEVMVCNAFCWETENASVLFLDRSLWHEPMAYLAKQRYSTAVTKASEESPYWDIDFASSGAEVPSLEQRIWEELKLVTMSGQVSGILETSAHAQWLELLDNLSSSAGLQTASGELDRLFLRIHDGLEKNSEVARRLKAHGYTASYAPSDWEALLSRAERFMRLYKRLGPPAVKVPVPGPELELQSREPFGESSRMVSNANENQRSLDRVTYLGGVLLPLSIVSGILSMGDTFGPGGSMFYVYWAAAVPLTIVSLLVIYADSIRKAEVWVEVAASQARNSVVGEPDGMPGQKPERPSTPTVEHGIPYSYVEPIPFSMVPEEIPGDDGQPEAIPEPAMVAHQRIFKGSKPKTWKKEELGWLGACKTILQLYNLQPMKGSPPKADVGPAR